MRWERFQIVVFPFFIWGGARRRAVGEDTKGLNYPDSKEWEVQTTPRRITSSSNNSNVHSERERVAPRVTYRRAGQKQWLPNGQVKKKKLDGIYHHHCV